MTASFRNLSILAFVQAGNLRNHLVKAARHSPQTLYGLSVLMAGLALFTLPVLTDTVLAQTSQDLGDLANNASTQLRAVGNLIIVGAGVVGICVLAYGAKLVFDKSKERADVSAGRIVAAFVGGGILLALSFIAYMVTNTLSGGEAEIGETLNF